MNLTDDYDHGTIVFRADEGKLINLDELHESIWATRLSGGTRSGLLKAEVTAVGEVVRQDGQLIVKVDGSPEHFILEEDPEIKPEDGELSPFHQLQEAVAGGGKVTKVSGRLEGWQGRWPAVLREKPPKPRKILVSSFE
jgi:hypothetical protein